MNALLAGMAPRILWLALAGFAVVTVLGGYTFAFKPGLSELNELRKARELSSADVASGHDTDPGGELVALRAVVQRLHDALYGEATIDPAVMASHVIQTLDGLSVEHAVTLDAVNPGRRSDVLSFAEIPFDVEASGSYPDLFRWLAAAEAALSPMVIKHFDIHPSAKQSVAMQIRLVAYRAPETP